MEALDHRRARSQATKDALMRAAEKLIAELGMENVSIREIVNAAGQKNESALQYHFKNLTGLLEAIHAERSAQVQSRRADLLRELLEQTPAPDLRQLCMAMVQPAFELARSSVDFRRYVRAFGHQLALAETSALSQVTSHGGGGASGQQLTNLLKEALPQLDTETYVQRMEAAVRLCSSSMYHQARQKNAFRGAPAELFLHSLVDALTGLLSAPMSAEAKAIARSIKTA